ncbi:MAG: hypothetical protein WA921_11860 [Ahrensia sp.]
MENISFPKRASAFMRAIDVSIVIVHLAVVALVVDWVVVSSFNLNIIGMTVVSLPILVGVIWATVKLWIMSGRADADQLLD